MRAQSILLALTSLLLLLSLFRAPYPAEQSLQHIPTGMALAVLAYAICRRWFSPTAYFCLIAFVWLHILGARYVYSNVPYDDWFKALTGASLQDWFGETRNHYDRLVHLLFGMLVMLPAVELAEHRGRMNRAWAIGFALCLTAGISACYEVIEWLLAVVLSPDQAEDYNGQQGDGWDAQKDMGLAILGSMFATCWLSQGVLQSSRNARHSP